MAKIIKKTELKVGDLVNHILYGREWVGVILKVSDEEDQITSKAKVLVAMVPGTRYESFFKKYTVSVRVSESQGWISNKWLLRVVN